jgi:O-antigen/teichoic acid export membrane protein
MSLLRKAFVINTAELISLGIAVLQTAVLARVLGPAGIGQYAVILSVLMLAPQVISLGMPMSFLYHSQHDPKNSKKYLLNALCSVLFLGLLGGAGLAFVITCKAEFFGLLPMPVLIGMWLYVPILLAEMIARNALMIQVEAYRLGLMRICSRLCNIIVVLVLYKLGVLNAPLAIICFAVGEFAGFVVGWSCIGKHVDFSEKLRWSVIRRLGSMGVRLSWGDLLVLVNCQVNILIIRYLLDNFENVGYFSRGQRIGMLVVTAGQSLLPVLFSKWASIAPDKLAEHVEKVLRLANSMGLIMLTGILLTGKWIIIVLYGREFLPAVVPMMILIPGAVMHLTSRILMQLLGSRGAPELAAVTLLAGIIINIVLCWVLIPVMGIIGAALSSTAGSFVSLLILTAIADRKYSVRFSKCLLLQKKEILGFL